MKLQKRDRRALLLLAGAGALFVILMLSTGGTSTQPVLAGAATIPAAEHRLAVMRDLAATVPGKEQLLKQVTGELEQREKGIIQAQTAAQAQAQLLDVVRRVAKAQTPPIDFGTVELSQEVRKLGGYGEVELSVPFACRIEDLVNFLAELARQPEAIATSEMRISGQDAKQKTIAVRLTVSGLVPARLIPEKKGAAQF